MIKTEKTPYGKIRTWGPFRWGKAEFSYFFLAVALPLPRYADSHVVTDLRHG